MSQQMAGTCLTVPLVCEMQRCATAHGLKKAISEGSHFFGVGCREV